MWTAVRCMPLTYIESKVKNRANKEFQKRVRGGTISGFTLFTFVPVVTLCHIHDRLVGLLYIMSFTSSAD